MRKVIEVEGMKCHGCETVIENNLRNLNGITYVKANHKEGRVTVEYDESKISLKNIVEKIESLGYKFSQL